MRMMQRDFNHRPDALSLISHPVFKKFWSAITDDDFDHAAFGTNKEAPRWAPDNRYPTYP